MPHSALYNTDKLIKTISVGDNKYEFRLDAGVLINHLFPEYQAASTESSITALSESSESPILPAPQMPILPTENTYRDLSDLFREVNDAQFNIVSTRNNEENAWVRDATAALPLAERMPHNAPVIEANNAVLRCLSRLRPIDYAVNHACLPEAADLIRQTLKKQFADFLKDSLNVVDLAIDDKQKLARINELETTFNTDLLKALYDADLTAGVETKEEAESLLFYYRNLGSLLDPTMAMVTRTYDEASHLTLEEAQFPVTQKTPLQHTAIKALEKKHRHTPLDGALAAEKADNIFAGLINADDRSLPAQTRKTHLAGAKNAFIVRNRLLRKNDPEAPEEVIDTLWLARVASPVYVGKGYEAEVVQQHTDENLVQLLAAGHRLMGAAAQQLHLTCLNTDLPWDNEDTIVHGVKQAAAHGICQTSLVPVNIFGTFLQAHVHGAPPEARVPFQKATRLERAAQIVYAQAKTPGTMSALNCASAQDRSGGVVVATERHWMEEQNIAHNLGLASQNIEFLLAKSGNAAEIATHHVHGSSGLKDDSLPHNYPFFGGRRFGRSAFAKETTAQLYRDSAQTNKINHVGNIDFLEIPTKTSLSVFKNLLRTYQQTLATLSPKCTLLKSTTIPTQNTVGLIDCPTNTAYVFANNQLYYIDKEKKHCDSLPLGKEILEWFKKTYEENLSDGQISLTPDELSKLVFLSDHDRGRLMALLHETSALINKTLLDQDLNSISPKQLAYFQEILWHSTEALKRPGDLTHIPALMELTEDMSKEFGPRVNKTLRKSVIFTAALIIGIAAFALAPLTSFASVFLLPIALSLLWYDNYLDKQNKTADLTKHLEHFVDLHQDINEKGLSDEHPAETDADERLPTSPTVRDDDDDDYDDSDRKFSVP